MAVIEKPILGSAPSCLCPQCGSTVNIPAPPPATSSGAEALLRQAREQISALQSQVSHLDQKAAAAIDRWADYEDELAQLRRQLAAANGSGGAHPSSRPTPTIAPPPHSAGALAATPVTPVSPTRTSFLPAGAANRISALLSPRAAKSSPNLKEAAAQPYSQVPTAMPTPPPTSSSSGTGNNNGYDYMQTSNTAYSVTPVTTPPPPRTPYGSFSIFGGKMQTPPSQQQQQQQQQQKQLQQQPQPMSPSTKELIEALTREQKLRRAAEGRLNDTSREVEELSVSLFEQANEMVAEERRARARLEARVAVLEQRDTDKKARLERLELAMNRIGRLRAMLDADTSSGPGPMSPKSDASSLSAEEAVEQHEAT